MATSSRDSLEAHPADVRAVEEGDAVPATPPAPRSGTDVAVLVEHLFRHESARMIATLTRAFGTEHLTLAEDVVQETLARALQTWPFYGIPPNPPAWIMRTARNLALDVVRRQKVFRDKESQIVAIMERLEAGPDSPILLDQEMADDRLRLMFVCCHPKIPEDAQAALALRTLCGFGVAEISRAFLTSEAAIAKRLTRAKQRIREARIPFEIPAGEALAPRLEGVLQTLYLLFNEGYKATTGDRLVREEVSREAIRLAELLVAHPAGNQPRTHALLALMLLNASRFPTRVDRQGSLLRLEHQDRSLWDSKLIARGLFHLAQSASGEVISHYHLLAAIAACHAVAPNYESTDWKRVLTLYDQLREFDPSPVVELNRAVAVANVHGPEAGLEAVAAIQGLDKLESYHLLYAVRGDFEARRKNLASAAAHFEKALQLTDLASERRFLESRLAACQSDRDHP